MDIFSDSKFLRSSGVVEPDRLTGIQSESNILTVIDSGLSIN